MHPLQTKWSFKFDNTDKSKQSHETWKDSIKHVATFDTIEGFRTVTDKIGFATQWPLGSNQHFFRDYIEPAWEDPTNCDGGKWVLELSKDDICEEVVNDLWLRTMAFCISEKCSDVVCGCVFSPRKFVDRICVWTRTKGPEVREIGKLWKESVGFTNQISFLVHENSLRGIRDRNVDTFYL